MHANIHRSTFHVGFHETRSVFFPSNRLAWAGTPKSCKSNEKYWIKKYIVNWKMEWTKNFCIACISTRKCSRRVHSYAWGRMLGALNQWTEGCRALRRDWLNDWLNTCIAHISILSNAKGAWGHLVEPLVNGWVDWGGVGATNRGHTYGLRGDGQCVCVCVCVSVSVGNCKLMKNTMKNRMIWWTC
jgi:hypothetical protein